MLFVAFQNSCLTVEQLGNKYYCNQCNRTAEAKRSTNFPELPRILMTHLGRFDNQLNKVLTITPMPIQLDCFCDACNKSRKNGMKAEHEYQLYGLITHSGAHLTSGHYIAYVRSLGNCLSFECNNFSSCCQIKYSFPDGNWFLCNDEIITPISQTDFTTTVQNDANLKTPYILFYVRNDLLEEQKANY